MYNIIRNNRNILMELDHEVITGFSYIKNDKIEYLYFSNIEDNVTCISIDQIGSLEIEQIPNNAVFYIYMSSFGHNKTDDLIKNVPYPLNIIEIIKRDDKLFIKFTNNVCPETWTNKWTIETYFIELINIANQYYDIQIMEIEERPVNEERYTLIFEHANEGRVQEAFSHSASIVREIIQKTESSLNGLVMLQKAINLWNENKNNSLEEFWQKFLLENSWVIAQSFSIPLILYHDKAYVGGKSINNKNGNIIDFTYKNKLTNNITLIEIKTPTTPLVGDGYRGVYSISKDLSGSINQLLHYKDKCQKDFYYLNNRKDKFEAFNPKCLLIAGTLASLDDEEKKAFELFRNELRTLQVITFDELFEKISLMQEIYVSRWRLIISTFEISHIVLRQLCSRYENRPSLDVLAN